MFELVLKSNFEIFECNFEALEAELKRLIQEKYDIVVTEDSVKDAKNVRAEINKGKKALETAWREKKAELEKPIKDLGEKAKSLFAVCDEAISKIDLQVSQFEAKKRELAVTLCAEYRDQVCEVKKLDPSLIDVSGFSNLSYVTEKGSLASAGKQAVDNLILAKVAEIAEQKQREAEAQMEIERIKQQAREELLQEQASSQAMEKTDVAEQNQVQENQEAPKVEDGKVSFSVNVEFNICTKGKYSLDLKNKVEDWIRKEIQKNTTLSQALSKIETRRI